VCIHTYIYIYIAKVNAPSLNCFLNEDDAVNGGVNTTAELSLQPVLCNSSHDCIYAYVYIHPFVHASSLIVPLYNCDAVKGGVNKKAEEERTRQPFLCNSSHGCIYVYAYIYH